LNEIIVITGALDGSIIDQIVVDTICVPEPVSMALVGLGLAAMSYRRKRSSR
jgi:hypothetical protein